MKAAVRCQSLDLQGLARAEKHGLREDWIGRQRKVRDKAPLVVGGLNLTERYAAHIDGARQNKGARKPVLHFIVKFPREVFTEDAPGLFAGLDRHKREALMVRQAVAFINGSHGGEAVFAARLDRDEAGDTVVDVFACPKYMKPSRSERREPAAWTSATRFGEELARKHQSHIRGRLRDATGDKPITSPRAVGIALQEELADWFERVNGVRLSRTLKQGTAKDRVEVEEWRAVRLRDEAREAIAQRDKARAEASRIETAAKGVGQAVAALAREMEAGTLVMGRDGRVYGEDVSAMRPGAKVLKGAIKAAAQAQTAMNERRAILDSVKTLWDEIRGAIPTVRASLQRLTAPPEERATARAARREIVRVSPMLRRAMAEAARGASSLPVKEPTPEPEVVADSRDLDGLGM